MDSELGKKLEYIIYEPTNLDEAIKTARLLMFNELIVELEKITVFNEIFACEMERKSMQVSETFGNTIRFLEMKYLKELLAWLIDKLDEEIEVENKDDKEFPKEMKLISVIISILRATHRIGVELTEHLKANLTQEIYKMGGVNLKDIKYDE